jgi:hypothetical protein
MDASVIPGVSQGSYLIYGTVYTITLTDSSTRKVYLENEKKDAKSDFAKASSVGFVSVNASGYRGDENVLKAKATVIPGVNSPIKRGYQ